MVNLFYFQCKDETDLFSRCFEYSAHACHVAQESQRCISVTAVLRHGAKSSHTFFNASCGTVRCKNGVPHICHAFRTWTWPLAERQSPTWPSHSKIRSARRLKHCCIELDVQKGGGLDGFPTIVKPCNHKALMSSSSKFRNFCIKMTLPVWNKWHSSHDDCRAGLARMWRRGKMLLLALAADVWFEHIWIKDEVNYWSMESNLWSLNIEMVFFTIRYVESNLCRIEMHNGTVCGIRFACFFQHATSRLLCLFCSFLRTCTDECFFPFFFDELHEASVFVLLLIAIWGLLYDIWSGLFSCLAVFLFNECEDPMCLNEA